jgi:vanillate O-demethylase ferredoxin subunit
MPAVNFAITDGVNRGGERFRSPGQEEFAPMTRHLVPPGSQQAVAPASIDDTVEMRLTAIVFGAARTNLFELRPVRGGAVPEFAPGAHVDVYLPNGTIRQYSIASSVSDRARYLLGVKLEAEGRGGSRCIHEELRVGQVFKIGFPRNNFPLAEDAALSIFIAGGIGITPIKCMIDRMQMIGRSWRLHYAVRVRDEALFLDDLLRGGDRLHLHVDSECGGKVIDVDAIIAAAPADAQLYCCGPAPMLAAFERACASRPAKFVHLERFSAPDNGAATGGAYTVELARSKRSIAVRADQTLLQALQAAGITIKTSCQQGICGTCETRVLSGTPDHRDLILSDDEKAANDTMMVCCSGSLGATLVLDL